MKTLLKITLFLLPLLSFGQQRWEVEIGDDDIREIPYSIVNTYDDASTICGVNISLNAFVLKFDINGEVLWHKTFFGPEVSCMDNDSAGSLVFAGHMDAYAWISHFSNCGDLLWCKNYQYNDQAFFTDVLLLENSIIACCEVHDEEYGYIAKLLNFNLDGELLWVKDIASPALDSMIMEPLAIFFSKVGESIFISGDCYYAYQSNPSIFHLRSMFIKIDSLLNPEWLLPFGMEDQIVGSAFGVIPISNDEYRGYGRYYGEPNVMNSILMDFDGNGIETGFTGIPNDSISPDVEDNELRKLLLTDDSLYLCAGAVGGIPHIPNPMGEWVMDSEGRVFEYQNHPGTKTILRPAVKTTTGQFVFTGIKENISDDIFLYKLNPDLSQAPIDTTTYNYDSLCDNLPIVSDTIYIDNCSIVTGIEDYEANTVNNNNTLSVKAYPSPARNSVTIECEEYGDFTLICYNMLGKQVYADVLSGENTDVINISDWRKGMYVAVVNGGNGKRGVVKFVVE